MRARAQRYVGSLDVARLARERWFAEKDRRVAGVELVDAVEAGDGLLALVDVRFADGGSQRYAMPDGDRLWEPLLARLSAGPVGAFALRAPACGDAGSPGLLDERALGRDQSNSSYVLGERLILKCYRRLEAGVHPEVELVAALTAAGVAAVPALRGTLVWRADGDWELALLQDYVPDAEDGWAWAQAELGRWREGTRDLGWAVELGRVTARIHTALAAADPALRAGAASGQDSSWLARAERELDAVVRAEPSLRPLEAEIRAHLSTLETRAQAPLVCRIHGDLHVGQVLRSPAGYHVVDFEGEPTRTLGERRQPDSPLRDVASMLRSFDNTARWVLRDGGGTDADWVEGARSAFLDAYTGGVEGSAIAVEPGLLRALELEKAVYEVGYAARVLPEWMPVARPALVDLLRA